MQARERGIYATVSTRATDGSVRIVVEDDGPGISPEQEAYVFDPFYTGRAHDGGTGLGLSIVRSIVESQGGSIEAKTSERGGTAVIIVLPRQSG